jgi:hypothetical protein
MAKANLQQLLNDTKSDKNSAQQGKALGKPKAVESAELETQKRAAHKPGEVNISAYFPAEVKSALRLVQAKTGNNVKQCLAEALTDYFRKHNVPVTIPMEQKDI